MNSKFQPGEETFDDVSGHRVLRDDQTPASEIRPEDEDTEGHRVMAQVTDSDDETEGHRFMAMANSEEPDDEGVEGHRLGSWNQAVGDIGDNDDVEGHRMQ